VVRTPGSSGARRARGPTMATPQPSAQQSSRPAHGPGTLRATGTMRAAVHRRFGGPEVVSVQTVPRPVPGPGELVLRVHASDVSVADHRMRARDLPPGFAVVAPFLVGFTGPRRPVLGMEAAGVVEDVGAGVTTFAPGDRVV